MIRKFSGKSFAKGLGCYIDEKAIITGDVTLGENVFILPYSSIRGDMNDISIGNNSNVQEFACLHTRSDNKLVIGERVTVGHNVVVHGATIGDNCILGVNCVIMDNVTVGKNCIIGAGTVIPNGKSIPDNSVVVGNPFKIIREATEKDIASITENASEYDKLRQKYLAETKE